MRGVIVILATTVLLGACSSESQTVPGSPATAKASNGAEIIACAVGGGTEFARVCEVERSQAEGALFLTVRHPDGAFRRFKVLADGRGLEPADGAEGASLRMNGGRLEVAIGPDRYLFPATMRTDAANP